MLKRFLAGALVAAALLAPRVSDAQLAISVANNGTTATVANALAILTGAPSTATVALTSTTDGIVGIVVSGAGTTGNAIIARAGIQGCVFDGATTAGHWVAPSTTTGGDCHDTGSATRPTGSQAIGQVLSTNGSGGTYNVALTLGYANAAGGASALNNYAVSSWYVANNPNQATNASSGTMAANTAYCAPGIIFQALTIDQLAADITTADSGGNIQLALYASLSGSSTNAGLPGTLLAATASISTTTATTVSASLSSSQSIATPGKYWFCATADNTTVTLLAWSNTAPGLGVLAGSPTLGNVLSGGSATSAVHAASTFNSWANFTSATSWTESTGAKVGPVLAFHVASVP